MPPATSFPLPLLATAADAPAEPILLNLSVWWPYIVLGIAMMAVPVLVSVLKDVLEIISRFRQSPPNHSLYAAKEELVAMEQRMTAKLCEAKEEAEEIETRFERLLGAMEGRILHRLDDGNKTFGEMNKEIGVLAAGLSEIKGRLRGKTGAA